jgi:hypothetical protein
VFLTSVVSDEKNVAPQKGLYLGEGVRDPERCSSLAGALL